MREKSGDRGKRISVSGFYPKSIRPVKSDRLLVYHTFVYEGQRSIWLMREQESARLKFLRRKFIEELEANDYSKPQADWDRASERLLLVMAHDAAISIRAASQPACGLL